MATQDPIKKARHNERQAEYRKKAIETIAKKYPSSGVIDLRFIVFRAESQVANLKREKEALELVLKARTLTLLKVRDLLLDSTFAGGEVFRELDARITLSNIRKVFEESDVGKEQAQTLAVIGERSKKLLVKFAREILAKYGEEEVERQ